MRCAVVMAVVLCAGVARAENLPKDTNEIKTLTVGQARELVARSKGADGLILNNLQSLDADTSEALAEFGGRVIHLDGLTAIDADTAEALARFRGQTLELNGLTTLSMEAAEALGAFQGLDGKGLYLQSLTTLDADTATALAANKKWDGQLPSITTFDSRDSIAIAEALAARKGVLSLLNLKQISPKTLAALIEKKDVKIPPIKKLELISEPDGSATEDFVIPDGFQKP